MIFNGRLNSGSSNKHLLVSLVERMIFRQVVKEYEKKHPFIEKDQKVNFEI